MLITPGSISWKIFLGHMPITDADHCWGSVEIRALHCLGLNELKQQIPMYKLEDLNGEELVGSFYQAELQKVKKTEDTIWEVEKILRKRRRQNKDYVFVKWLNYPSSFNSWILERDLRELS